MAPCDNSKFLISACIPFRLAALDVVATKGRHSGLGLRCPFFSMKRSAFLVPVQNFDGFRQNRIKFSISSFFKFFMDFFSIIHVQ